MNEFIQFNKSIALSKKIVKENEKQFLSLLHFLIEFKIIYQREKKKLPYHINLIDELHANENAHSRILEKLLSQKETTNNSYELLESFIQYIFENNKDKQDFQKIKINKPQITQEKKRIDLWVRDQNNYTIIIENKVHNAKDQGDGKKVEGGQLERYINTTKEYGFKEEQIYVLYLPPTYEKEPTKESWGKYYESTIYRDRYLNLSFKDDILTWLKYHVLPNIRLKDKYLSSAMEQYIDHLEGKFSLRTINNSMNMHLQEFIKKELGLNGMEPENALKIILDKKEDMQNALNQLTELEKKIHVEHFPMWEKQLKANFPNLTIVGNWNKPDSCINIGVKMNSIYASYSLLIEYNYNRIYFGIGKHYATPEKNYTLNFDEVINDLKLQGPEEWWYAWEYTTFSDAYFNLKFLIEKIELRNTEISLIKQPSTHITS